MTILEELYNGNIDPSGLYIKKNSEYQKLNERLVDMTDKLMPLLSDEEKILCKGIEDTVYAMSSISEKEKFIEGFRLGAKIMWDVLNFKSENFS